MNDMEKMRGAQLGKELVKEIGRIMEPFNRRTLADEVAELERGSRDVEELTRSGIGPASFAAELARRNSAYRQFSNDMEAGEKFAREAREAGQRMQQRSPGARCRQPVTDSANGDELDWARRMNSAGARMRDR